MSAVPQRPRPISVRDESRRQADVSGSTARHATVHESAALGGGDAPRSDASVAASRLRVSPGAMLNDTVPLATVRTSEASGGCDGIGASEAPGGGVGPGVFVGLGALVGDGVGGAVVAGALVAGAVGDAVGGGVGGGVVGAGVTGGTVVITVVPPAVGAAVDVAAAVERVDVGTLRSVSAHAPARAATSANATGNRLRA
jgi:hypothetical protein